MLKALGSISNITRKNLPEQNSSLLIYRSWQHDFLPTESEVVREQIGFCLPWVFSVKLLTTGFPAGHGSKLYPQSCGITLQRSTGRVPRGSWMSWGTQNHKTSWLDFVLFFFWQHNSNENLSHVIMGAAYSPTLCWLLLLEPRADQHRLLL